jgi:hypothetical protein
MELKLLEFINENPDNWKELIQEAPYHISITESHSFILLKYSQIHSNFNIPMVRECRGIILDENFTPVCIPFYKFGNYGESYADEIDWSSAVVEEKLDGSIIKVWFDKKTEKWIISTNGTIFAEDAKVGNDKNYKNFAELFYEAAARINFSFYLLNRDNTYMFELTTPHNRVIVPYFDFNLTHIGTRNNISFQELNEDIGVAKPKVYKCNNLNDLIQMAAELPCSDEGYVVKDKNYNRIKVKSPAYVAIARLLDGINEKRLIEIIRTNEVEELLTYFPEYAKPIQELKMKIEWLRLTLENLVNVYIIYHEPYASQKDFAEIATKSKFPSFLFMYKAGKTQSANEWIWKQSNEKILEHLKTLESLNA